MHNERRGGARLDRTKPAKRKKQTADPGVSDGTAGAEVSTPGRGWAKLSRKARITIIVVAALVAALLILALVYKSWARLPDLPAVGEEGQTPDPITGVIPSSKPGSARKEGFYTFLVVGRDTGGGGNTDTLMLVSYDVPNQALRVMSIPRDTMVNARHRSSNRKINGVWNLGLYYADKDSEKEGIDYLMEAVGDMLGFVPDFHVIVNWTAFGRLVDAIGGVDFEVPFEMKYTDPTQNLVIDQAAGYRHLTGEDAMQVVRWRHNNSYSVQYADADLGRIRTQQALMKEIVKKCLKIENVANINKFAQIFTEEVETDLTVGNLVAFAERAILGGLTMDNVTFVTMPITGANAPGASYVQAQPEELLGILNDSFNPYVEPLQMEELEILQYSASRGFYLYSGTGTGKAPVYTTQPAGSGVVTAPQASKAPAGDAPDPEEEGETPPEAEPEEGDEAPESAPPQEIDPESGPQGIGEGSALSTPEPSEPEEGDVSTPPPTHSPENTDPDAAPDLGIPL